MKLKKFFLVVMTGLTMAVCGNFSTASAQLFCVPDMDVGWSEEQNAYNGQWFCRFRRYYHFRSLEDNSFLKERLSLSDVSPDAVYKKQVDDVSCIHGLRDMNHL